MINRELKLEIANQYLSYLKAESKERLLMAKLLTDAYNISTIERIRLRVQLLKVTTELLEYDRNLAI